MQPQTAFTIRLATSDDIPAIESLIAASARELQKHDYTSAQIEASIGSSFGVDRQLLHDRTYFVATPGESTATLAGCGGWSYRSTLFGSDAAAARDPTPLDPATGYAKIRAIFVHPAYARQGLGTLILQYAESAARSAGFTRLEMGSTLTGYPLYARRGYVEVSRIALPMRDAADRVIVRMQKTIT